MLQNSFDITRGRIGWLSMNKIWIVHCDCIRCILNPLRSNSDQRQIYLCNINALSVREAMRIKDMITQREYGW